MLQPYGMYKCDFCGEEEGEFDMQTGNHDSCTVLDIGKRMRTAQKKFYRNRKTVSTSEHQKLLHESMRLEHEFDKALEKFFASPTVPDQQPSLL